MTIDSRKEVNLREKIYLSLSWPWSLYCTVAFVGCEKKAGSSETCSAACGDTAGPAPAPEPAPAPAPAPAPQNRRRSKRMLYSAVHAVSTAPLEGAFYLAAWTFMHDCLSPNCGRAYAAEPYHGNNKRSTTDLALRDPAQGGKDHSRSGPRDQDQAGRAADETPEGPGRDRCTAAGCISRTRCRAIEVAASLNFEMPGAARPGPDRRHHHRERGETCRPALQEDRSAQAESRE